MTKETQFIKRQYMLTPGNVERLEGAADRRGVSPGEELRRILDIWFGETDEHLSPAETIYQLAMTAGRHAGTESAHKHGREQWTEEDLRTATEVTGDVLLAVRGKRRE